MIIIPARLKSTRLPNKVLAKIGNEPMVIKTANAVKELDKVVIATDSDEVMNVAKSYGIKAVLTSTSHKSGTDRIYEAAKKLNLKDDEIIINLQADEPFIEKEVVSALIDLTKKYADNKDIIATSCYKIINSNEANDPNIVKVVTNLQNLALYFSRSKIPFSRDNNLNSYKAHLGLYGFTTSKLNEFINMQKGSLEDIEKLEQLRILDNNKQIALIEVKTKSFGIDTKEDLQKAIKLHTL
jgi:3-deoxy-manno-octulosonate cytidylyltransferase (CMP-KDO synthetase)